MLPIFILTPEEARVLGCLIEKSQATPEYYPMSLNALMNACNQKNSRDPVVHYSEEEVLAAIELLREKGLCSAVSGAGRVIKYSHRASESLSMNSAEMCVMSLLLLRGPQTAGEINSRSNRQYNFSSIEVVQEILTALTSENKNLIALVPRRTGQKEDRYRHVFFHYDDSKNITESPPQSYSIRDDIESLKKNVALLQEENLLLNARLTKIDSSIEQMKKDFY